MPTHLEEKANLFFGAYVIYKHKFNIKNNFFMMVDKLRLPNYSLGELKGI